MIDQFRRERPFLPGPGDCGSWVALCATLQRQARPPGHALHRGRDGSDGGREGDAECVTQLHGRLQVVQAEEGACVARPDRGDGQPCPLQADATVTGHLLTPHRQQFLLPSGSRDLFHDEFVLPWWSDLESLRCWSLRKLKGY